ncbi:DUF2628 domain-containing protein [Acinetobacter sp. ANC 3813]|uniref:DUF2628 domain-containing protein n=1 Tax=Acinetobacter sp. ANC 3813 TaxID=1977873 RepID=UPI000A33E2EE|nr:DUF2628 domain-containing protein [Acinetobacter sp. ANC 3813]OTG90080.1 hypothetical protein B9T34_09650 [Acinetobacter sp. ANC 3813]
MTNENVSAPHSAAALLAMFIGPRAQAYSQVSPHQAFSFSWAGLIFGAYWLLYRKMYAYFFTLLACGFFAGLLMQIIGLSLAYALAVALIPNVILGCFGKRLYIEFAQSKVKAYMQNQQYSAKVFAEAGGTAFSMPILWLFSQIGLYLMLTTPFLKY